VMPNQQRASTIVLVLLVFLYGALKVNDQAGKIQRLIDDQSPLVFAFENTGNSGRLTFVVTCTREEEKDGGKYICTTKQTEPVVSNITVVTPVAVPAPTATPRPAP
jgi:hypothetical protein